MTVVASDIVDCLAGSPPVGELDQAFLFLTAGPAGVVDTCLLSRMELRVTSYGFAAVVGSRRARANLSERPVATIVAVCGDEAHTFTCGVEARLDEEGVSAFALGLREHRRDGLGIELLPMRYRVEAKLRVQERWDRTAELLQQLESAVKDTS